MRFVKQWNIAAVAAASAVILGAAVSAAPAGAASTTHKTAAPRVTQSGGVSPDAALGTPQLDSSPKNEEVVKQIAQCGNTMYAVGQFTTVSQGSTVYTRNNILSFSASAPSYTMNTWAPDVNGQVNTIAFSGGNCADAYIGGDFTSINGTAVENIAEIDTSTGDVVSGFGHSANYEIWTIQAVNDHLLVGGDFTYINGSHNPYMASVSPNTGLNDGFLDLSISGDYQYCAAGGSPCTKAHHSEVYNQQLSHGGTLDLVEGHFTSVGGLPRQQIFMLNVGGSKATVTGWTSPEFDGSDPSAYPYYQCWPSEAFYIRSAAWSPDDSTVYLAATGYHPAQTNSNPRKGLCDSVSAFPATQSSVTHTWINYSGCDSFYSVSADSSAVYAAGHPRWANNNNGCNKEGPGATPDFGLWGLTPSTGALELNSSNTALYTMTRDNAGNMLITSGGLWISSDNRNAVNKCGSLKGPAGHNAADHAGICLLPYSS